MQLYTPVNTPVIRPAIDYNSRLVLLGSCFATNMGSKLQYYGFNTLVNPFGILFNPYSIKLLIERSLTSQHFDLNDIEQHYTYLAHSDLNGTSSQQVLMHINQASNLLLDHITHASHVFITLGTAWVYKHIDKQLIVANCHQQPQQLFNKELLSIATISSALTRCIELIRQVNPKVQITFTLSPVRHSKDGFVANQRSKSRLHESIQSVVDSHSVNYFAAYELVMDQLRDYRFYKRDMIHLNDLGIDLVWNRFRESVINNNTYTIMNNVEKYRKLQAHQPKDQQKHNQLLADFKLKLITNHPELKL